MRKSRRKQLPPPPQSINELGDLLVQSNFFRIHSGVNKDQFYQATLVLEDTTCLIFTHIQTLEQIGRVEELHLDASIEVDSTTPPAYYLMTAHSVQSYNVIHTHFYIMVNLTYIFFTVCSHFIRNYDI